MAWGGKETAPAETSGKPQRADEIMPPEAPRPLPSPGAGQGRPQTIDISAPEADQSLSGGLGGFLDKLRKGGLGQEADSWVSTGPNKPVEPGKLGAAVGEMTIKEIAERAGTTPQDIVEILTQVLPQLVDNLTPQGKVPTPQDVQNYGRRA